MHTERLSSHNRVTGGPEIGAPSLAGRSQAIPSIAETIAAQLSLRNPSGRVGTTDSHSARQVRGMGAPVFVFKLDVKKAYDSVLWPALQWMCEARGVPPPLTKCILAHSYTSDIVFRTCDDTVKFWLQPTCGMPQGAPESPLLYAWLMEDLIHLAEAKLACDGKSAGLPVRPTEVDMDPETVATTYRQTAYTPAYRTYFNFADDMYVQHCQRLHSDVPPHSLLPNLRAQVWC